MNTINTNVIREIRPGAVVAIVGVLALSLAAIAALVAQIDAAGGGILAGIGDYIAKVGEALGSE
jgi:hypothetical protein